MELRKQIAHALGDLSPRVHEAVPPAVRRTLRHRLGHYYAWEAGFDHHHTPVPADGETNGPPDFVGIGVQKAGTSWWYRLVVDHPGMSQRPSIHKERHFFARFGTDEFGPEDVADYRAWFPRRKGTMTGEWTPDYFSYPWVPPLLAQAAPDAKLLLLLRDPVQRFRSGLTAQLRSGANHVGTAQSGALARSLYADALRRWQAHVPSGQLLVMQYEACAADPAGQLRRTYEFLGLDPTHQPEHLRRAVNKTAEGSISLSADAVGRLEEIVAPDIAATAKLVPDLDLSLWPSAGGGR